MAMADGDQSQQQVDFDNRILDITQTGVTGVFGLLQAREYAKAARGQNLGPGVGLTFIALAALVIGVVYLVKN
jgi:hypothetical protein